MQRRSSSAWPPPARARGSLSGPAGRILRGGSPSSGLRILVRRTRGALHGEMIAGGAQILADGEDVAADGG